MIGFRVRRQVAFLDLDEIADMHIFGQFSAWSQAGKGADAPGSTDHCLLDMGKGGQSRSRADAGVLQYAVGADFNPFA